jgi:hypothetical protein
MVIRGGLILERFSLWLKSSQKGAILNIFYLGEECAQDSDLAPERFELKEKTFRLDINIFRNIFCEIYSLMNMRQLQILFKLPKTWHRTVC